MNVKMNAMIYAILANGMFQKFCKALIILVLGVLAIRIIGKVLTKALEKSRLEKAAHVLILSLAKTALYILLGLIVASTLGIDVTSIVALASVLTLALSLALQNMVSNIIGGFTILYTQPFHSGDYVEIAAQSGTVQEINMTYTKLTTPDNKVISIPNSAVVAAQIVNYSTEPTRRVDVAVTVARMCHPRRSAMHWSWPVPWTMCCWTPHLWQWSAVMPTAPFSTAFVSGSRALTTGMCSTW